MKTAHRKVASDWCRIGIAALSLCVFVSSFEVNFGSALAHSQEIGPAKIQLIDGSVLTGSVDSIDQDGIVSGKGINPGLNLQDVLSITTEKKPTSALSASVIVIPVGGGRLVTREPQIADDTLLFLSPVRMRQLPLQAVRAVVWKSSPTIKNSILNPSPENDRVIVESADGERSVEGLIESVDVEAVHINYKGKSRTIGIEKVKAIVMADLDLSAPTASLATLRSVDGSKWIGVITGLIDGELKMKIVGGGNVSLSVEKIIDIAIASDRLVFLSDLDPIDVQERPLFSIKRPFRRDQSVGANPMTIRLADSDSTMAFSKGLGTQSFTQLVFENSRGFNRLKTTVGIDAETNGRGDCKMKIWGDGIELWTARVRANDGPLPVDLDISGMKKITLIVDPGEKFDLGDHANWGNARFLKTN